MAPTLPSPGTLSPGPLSPGVLARNLADLSSAKRWYVGFSGGVDSTVLLHLLLACRRDNPDLPPVSAIHVDHGLQAPSQAWGEHCARICHEWQVPIEVRRVDTASYGSGEAAARAARYGVFQEIVGPGEVLLLAHHLDDQVETFFLRLMRGAGVEGLSAMPPRRDLGANGKDDRGVGASGSAALARPLLDVPRAELEAYARAQSLEYVEDPSNADGSFDRNFLRNEVLPLLASRWPRYRGAVQRAAGHMAAASQLLRETLSLPSALTSPMGDPGISLEELLVQGDEAAALLLRHRLGSHGFSAPDQVALLEFIRQLRQAANDARPRLVQAEFVLERYRGGVYLLPGAFSPESMELVPGVVLDVEGVGRLSLSQVERDGFLLATGEVPLLKWREGGERISLPGRGHSVSLKQFLQERGVPPWWRERIPLLMLGDEMLCVGDLTPCVGSRWREAPGEGEILWQLSWERDLAN